MPPSRQIWLIQIACRVIYNSFVIAPIAQHPFFKQPEFKRLLNHNLLQIMGLTAKIHHFVSRGHTCSITRQSTLFCFHEVLRPFVVNTLKDALTPLGIILCMTLPGSRRHSSALLSSPRSPSRTILIFSSDD
jgi:hypothetical protein